jgi:hypothetical protein
VIIEEPLYYSYSGNVKHRVLHGLHTAESKDALRLRGISLLLSLRDSQLANDEKPTAAVWLDKLALTPTKAEIEAYRQRTDVLVARDAERRAKGGADPDEPPPVVDGVVNSRAEPTDDDLDALVHMTLPEDCGEDTDIASFDIIDDDFDM